VTPPANPHRGQSQQTQKLTPKKQSESSLELMSEAEQFEDFDYTTQGFDYIEDVLHKDAPIHRDRGDNRLVVILARDDVPMLRELLKAHAVFPRDTCMEELGSTQAWPKIPGHVGREIRYDTAGARLLLEFGGRPPGAWLVQAILADDVEASTRLDALGARLSFQERYECEVRDGPLVDHPALLRYDPLSDDCFQYAVARYFKFDLAEIRSIEFDSFHEHLCDEDFDYDGIEVERAAMEELLCVPIVPENIDAVRDAWYVTSAKHDNVLLRAITTSLPPPLSSYPLLTDGRIDVHVVLQRNARHSTLGTMHRGWIARRAKMVVDENVDVWEAREHDQSAHGWRACNVVKFLMTSTLDHIDFRLEILRKVIDEKCIDVNSVVCDYVFDTRKIESFTYGFFDRDWIPPGGSIINEFCALVPATMLDIAVYEDFSDAAELLLKLGARVDNCLVWTNDRLINCVHDWAWDVWIGHCYRRRKELWSRLRRLAPLIAKIVMFVRCLSEATLTPDGPFVKRARVAFNKNADRMNEL